MVMIYVSFYLKHVSAMCNFTNKNSIYTKQVYISDGWTDSYPARQGKYRNVYKTWWDWNYHINHKVTHPDNIEMFKVSRLTDNRIVNASLETAESEGEGFLDLEHWLIDSYIF